MNWYGAIVFLFAFWVTSAVASENESSAAVAFSTNPTNVSEEHEVKLDSKLRTALLKALTDLENEETGEDSDDDDERNVERAHASAITIVEDDFSDFSPSSVKDKTAKPSNDEVPDAKNSSIEPSNEKAQSILFQKSQSLQAQSITSFEHSPLDPLKDAEQIITSASNSFGTETQNEPRSIARENQNEKNFSATLNSISNTESKKPDKTTSAEKLSIGKPVDEPPFIKTFIKPLEQPAESQLTDVKPKDEESELTTETTIEVSTEENEAKVEQVQFFSAPLVAAFTVHQDEMGQPKKVEPIFNNVVNVEPVVQPKNSPRVSQVFNSNSFNSLNLQQKQQLLEQQLQQLREQQLQLFSRNNLAASNQVLSQTSFNQAINQNFNQLDPVFTEPDRSIVSKLASIDPNNLLAENAGPVLSRFTSREAILPVLSQVQPSALTNPKSSGDVSFVSSISFDPLAEAGKLPENAQILPNKEPTGFHNFVKLAKQPSAQDFIQPSQQLTFNGAHQAGNGNFFTNVNLKREPDVQTPNRFLRQELGTGNLGFRQNTFSIVPAQQPIPPKHELGYFADNNRFLRQNEARPQIFVNNQHTRLLKNNGHQNSNSFPNAQEENRFFQSNLVGTSPQSLNVQQSVQPFGSQPLISSSGSQFLTSNSQIFLKTNQNPISHFNQPQRFNQNNRILRSNPESTFLTNSILFQTPVLQNYKYSRPFGYSAIRLH